MARKPEPGKCVHCLGEFERLNWDHVFPKSWYTDTTLMDLYKWQIPSCIHCNDEYGRLEKDLMIRIGLCLDPDDPSSKGIVDKALRSIDPSKGKNKKDKQARANKRLQILGQMIPEDSVPKTAIYPNFGLHENIPEKQYGVTINAGSIKRLNEKIVRGIMYIEDGVFIEPPYHIDSFTLTDEAAQPIIEIIDKFAKIYAREPGIIVKRATVKEDKLSSVFAIDIWNRFKMYSTITPNQSLNTDAQNSRAR